MERLDRFMARANAAYYRDHDPFGDFATAPEISQVFGEIIGLWAAVAWRQIGAPDPVILAEAGPGRGTLMADAWRAVQRVAQPFASACRMHLIETSPRLRAIQEARLPGATWHTSLADVPAGPIILIANEFLDALPIRQFVREAQGWTERHVCDGHFTTQPAEAPGIAPGIVDVIAAEIGETVEIGEAACDFARQLARRIATEGGAALILDYGPAQSAAGDSLQALHDGHPAPPLDAPGSRDLSAHVDFAALSGAARSTGAAVFGPVPQGLFLARLGLFERTGILARTLAPARGMALIEAARRLAEPDQMGRLFKALALCPPHAPAPPGFEA